MEGLELVVRSWRVRAEGPGYMLYFDPSREHVVLYDGPDLAYELREGREAGEAGAASKSMSGVLPDSLQVAFELEG